MRARVIIGTLMLGISILLLKSTLGTYFQKLPFRLEATSSPGANDTTVYKINLSSSAKFWKGDTVFYQINDINSSGLINHLFDEQEADPLHGVLTPIPETTFESGPTTKEYYPATAVIDLGGYYKITNVFIYKYYGTDTLCMLYGSPSRWSNDTLKISTGGKGWKDFGDTVYTRYLKVFYANKGYQKVREFIPYGYRVRDSLSRTDPKAHPLPAKTTFTMGQFMGFNQIGPREVDSVGALMRHYLQQDWMDTVTATHNIDSIRFVFTKFGHPTNNTSNIASTTNYFFPDAPDKSEVKTGLSLTPNDFHQMALGKTGYFDVTQSIPVYAKVNKHGKPIDPVINPDMDATDPNSYGRLARMMWNYAAYYGFETHNPDSVQTPYPRLSGLGLRAFVESGNEMNQNWSGRKNHYTPHEFIAYSSAYYDGNLGEMGPRMGVKNADPGMEVVAAGTAGASIDYLKGMQYYAYYTRKDHSTPFDILNFHVYPSNGTNGSGTNKHGISPENYFGEPDNPVKKYIEAANELFPGKPVWLTEWGYDRNRSTKISVPVIKGLDSAQIQAQWIARFWLMLSFTGVQRSTIFQLRNDPLRTMYDSVGTTTFNTTGLTDGHYVGDAYSPKIYATSWYAYPAYYYQRTIWWKLYNYKPDSIIYENHDSIWVYKYRNAIHKDSVAYVIWSGTQTNKNTDKFNIKTGHPDARVDITQLADKKMLGKESMVMTNSKGEVNLHISETPQMIFTKDGTYGGQLIESRNP